jgi:uncharacterized protein YdiU (UPF0061 family)
MEKWKQRRKRQKEGEREAEERMKSSNPAVIPRNHKVEEALDAAVEARDYGKMLKLLDVLSQPYTRTQEQQAFAQLPPPSSRRYVTYCGT